MSRHYILFFLFLFIVLTYSSFAFAHDESGTSLEQFDLLQKRAVRAILLVSVSSAFLVLIALLGGSRLTEPLKWFLFLGISIPVLLVTFYAAGTTVYQNYLSETKGPVHWHADFEIWNCGTEVQLLDPSGLTNRIGSPLFHEHNDGRVHVEGTLRATEDVSLHHFFEIIGGHLSSERLDVPTNEGVLSLENGYFCFGEEAELQVFLFHLVNFTEEPYTYTQVKLTDFPNYILTGETQVPPGDCFIVEFDIPKTRTDHLCESYRLAQEQGRVRESYGR